MNKVTLVGRLVEDPKIENLSKEQSRTVITLAISRDYKNSEGDDDVDFIKCVLWNGIASATKDYCHKGDVVSVKGKLQSRNYETEDKEKKYVTEVIVEKITFIQSRRSKE